MAWVFLVVAGFFEVGMVMGLSLSEGFSKTWPSVFMVVSAIISFSLLAEAMKVIPAGTAYAVWTGIGAVGAILMGILFLRESADLMRLGALALIVAGVISLKFTEG